MVRGLSCIECNENTSVHLLNRFTNPLFPKNPNYKGFISKDYSKFLIMPTVLLLMSPALGTSLSGLVE